MQTLSKLLYKPQMPWDSGAGSSDKGAGYGSGTKTGRDAGRGSTRGGANDAKTSRAQNRKMPIQKPKNKPQSDDKISGNPYNKPAPPEYDGFLQKFNDKAFDFFNKHKDPWGRPDGVEKQGDITQSIVNGNISHRWRQEGMDYNMSQTMNPVSYGDTDLAREFNRRGGYGGARGEFTTDAGYSGPKGVKTLNEAARNAYKNPAGKGTIMKGIEKVAGYAVDGIFGIGGAVIGGKLAGPIGAKVGSKVMSKVSKTLRAAGKGTPMRNSGPGAAPTNVKLNLNFTQSGNNANYMPDETIIPIEEGPIKPKKKLLPKKVI